MRRGEGRGEAIYRVETGEEGFMGLGANEGPNPEKNNRHEHNTPFLPSISSSSQGKKKRRKQHSNDTSNMKV